MKEERNVIICARLDEVDPFCLVPKSSPRLCNRCRTMVVISPASAQLLVNEVPTPELLCEECAAESIEEFDEFRLVPGQEKEIKQFEQERKRWRNN